ncbi:MAG: hypothetical protein R6U68_15955 [Desulfobacteraceae bacterium]
MTHSHHHTHDHDHDHGHGHHHHDHSAQNKSTSELSFKDKMAALLDHWIEHNNSHKDNYLSWADKAEKESLAKTASLLNEAARISEDISEKLKAALEDIRH